MEARTAIVSKGVYLSGRFWLAWVAASTGAILLGFVLLYLFIAAVKAIAPATNEDRLMGWAMFPALGLLMGAAQWLVLRRHVDAGTGWWIPATTVGWLAIPAAGALLSRVLGVGPGREPAAQDAALSGLLIAGLSIGVLQLPILWRHIRRPPLWILASAIGWLALYLVIGKSIDRTMDMIALGAVPAMVTGLALLWPSRVSLEADRSHRA